MIRTAAALALTLLTLSGCGFLHQKKSPTVRDVIKLQEKEALKEEERIEREIEALQRKAEIYRQLEKERKILRVYVGPRQLEDGTTLSSQVISVPFTFVRVRPKATSEKAVEYIVKETKRRKERQRPKKTEEEQKRLKEKKVIIKKEPTTVQTGSTRIITP